MMRSRRVVPLRPEEMIARERELLCEAKAFMPPLPLEVAGRPGVESGRLDPLRFGDDGTLLDVAR